MKIAIIDDNNTVLKINQIMLKKEGFILEDDIVELYLNFYDFFDNNSKKINEYDVVVCDYDLGLDKKNGLDLLKELKLIGLKGAAVLLTSDDTMMLKAKVSLSKNISYIAKDKSDAITKLGHIINLNRKIQINEF